MGREERRGQLVREVRGLVGREDRDQMGVRRIKRLLMGDLVRVKRIGRVRMRGRLPGRGGGRVGLLGRVPMGVSRIVVVREPCRRRRPSVGARAVNRHRPMTERSSGWRRGGHEPV